MGGSQVHRVVYNAKGNAPHESPCIPQDGAGRNRGPCARRCGTNHQPQPPDDARSRTGGARACGAAALGGSACGWCQSLWRSEGVFYQSSHVLSASLCCAPLQKVVVMGVGQPVSSRLRHDAQCIFFLWLLLGLCVPDRWAT